MKKFNQTEHLKADLSAALATVQQLRDEKMWSITCVHHTDEERSKVPLGGNCPICFRAQLAQLRAENAKLKGSEAEALTATGPTKHALADR